MWNVLAALVAKVLAELFGVALKTKKEESHVETVQGPLEPPATPADVLLERYGRM